VRHLGDVDLRMIIAESKVARVRPDMLLKLFAEPLVDHYFRGRSQKEGDRVDKPIDSFDTHLTSVLELGDHILCLGEALPAAFALW